MPLNYEIKKRTFGFDETRTEKYVVSAKRGHTVSYEDILKEVAKQSHLNSGEVYTAIEALIDVSITFMQQGHGVKLGDFGTFRMSLSSEGVDAPEQFDAASHVRRTRLIFTPGVLLKAALATITVEQALPDTAQ